MRSRGERASVFFQPAACTSMMFNSILSFAISTDSSPQSSAHEQPQTLKRASSTRNDQLCQENLVDKMNNISLRKCADQGAASNRSPATRLVAMSSPSPSPSFPRSASSSSPSSLLCSLWLPCCVDDRVVLLELPTMRSLSWSLVDLAFVQIAESDIGRDTAACYGRPAVEEGRYLLLGSGQPASSAIHSVQSCQVGIFAAAVVLLNVVQWRSLAVLLGLDEIRTVRESVRVSHLIQFFSLLPLL
jgi:hypothetical protein